MTADIANAVAVFVLVRLIVHRLTADADLPMPVIIAVIAALWFVLMVGRLGHHIAAIQTDLVHIIGGGSAGTVREKLISKVAILRQTHMGMTQTVDKAPYLSCQIVVSQPTVGSTANFALGLIDTSGGAAAVRSL